MDYLHDVWVNWFEHVDSAYDIYEYYEWYETDSVQLIEQMPILYINKRIFNIIENSLLPLPQSLLKKIHKRSYFRQGYYRKIIEYASIITDGERMLAFDTMDSDIPVRKSRLTPKQFQQIHKICKYKQRIEFVFTKEEREQLLTFKQNEKFPVQKMICLTRKEREMKKILLQVLDELKTSNNPSELLYWISEWDHKNYLEKITYKNHYTIDKLWSMLYEQASIGWSKRHEKFTEQFLRTTTGPLVAKWQKIKFQEAGKQLRQN